MGDSSGRWNSRCASPSWVAAISSRSSTGIKNVCFVGATKSVFRTRIHTFSSQKTKEILTSLAFFVGYVASQQLFSLKNVSHCSRVWSSPQNKLHSKSQRCRVAPLSTISFKMTQHGTKKTMLAESKKQQKKRNKITSWIRAIYGAALLRPCTYVVPRNPSALRSVVAPRLKSRAATEPCA